MSAFLCALAVGALVGGVVGAVAGQLVYSYVIEPLISRRDPWRCRTCGRARNADCENPYHRMLSVKASS